MSFVTLPTDDAFCEASKVVKAQLPRQTRTKILKAAKNRNRLPQQNQAKNIFDKIWKRNAVDETDKKENEESNIFATVGCRIDDIQEGKTCFGTSSLRPLAAAFRMLVKQSCDEKIAVADESVIDDVFDHSTAEELVMSIAFVYGNASYGFWLSSDKVGRIRLLRRENITKGCK